MSSSSIPDVISFSSVLVLDRERSEVNGIESLADSIADDGLIQPLVLTEGPDADTNESRFLLIAGGRRHAALSLLIERGDQEPFLFHGETSCPGRPGFLLRGETSALKAKVLELKENLDRYDLDWRDALRTLIKAYRLAVAEARERGLEPTDENPLGIDAVILETFNRDYGAMLDVRYQSIDAALRIYNALERDPKSFAGCNTLKEAYTFFLKQDSVYLAKLFGTRGMGKLANAKALPQLPVAVTGPDAGQRPDAPIGIVVLNEQRVPSTPLPVEVPLSSSFFHCNGLDFMAEQPPGFCHHIITDPDYAIGVDVLDSHPNNRKGTFAQGVAQASVEDSLADLRRFFSLARRALPESGGYLIFWYALNHHEKLQAWVQEAGFAVQPHPLIWNKIDFTGRSNTAPEYQWPKSTEFAMVCRKPGCRLTKVQTSNLYSQDAKNVTKLLNHAFAKPFEIWRWIYRAIAIKGQRTFDPFVGSGSSAIAAILEGLCPLGCEIQEDNYNTLMLNMRSFYRKHLGEHVTFT